MNAAQTAGALKRLQAISADAMPVSEQMQHGEWENEMSLMRLFGDRYWRKRYTAGFYTRESPPLTTYFWSDRAIMQNEIAFDNAWINEMRKPYAARLPLPAIPNDAIHQWEDRGTSEADRESAKHTGYLNGPRVSIWYESAFYDAETRLMLATLALSDYRYDHGSYPESLAQLTPKYLSSVPIDPFSMNAPLQYRRVGENYLLYSIGPDGVDDGGKAIDSITDKWGNKLSSRLHRLVLETSKGDIVVGNNM